MRVCWWILNCHNSRGLIFSEILVGVGGLYLLERGGGLVLFCNFFAHKLLYKNLTFLFHWIYVSKKLMKVFLKSLPTFLIDFSFYVIFQKFRLQQSWEWHDSDHWRLYETWQGKSLFYWVLKIWGGTISLGVWEWKMTGEGGKWFHTMLQTHLSTPSCFSNFVSN